MSSKYVDTAAIMQVIGSIFQNSKLLELDDKYILTEDDFPNAFHKTVFGCLYKLHELGVKDISLKNISDFLSTRPEAARVYNAQKGDEWLLEVAEKSMPTAFDYYYMRVKKMTLLRELDNHGIDVSNIYDPNNILDVKKKQLQEEALDNMSLIDIVTRVNDIIEEIKYRYVDNEFDEVVSAGVGINELIDSFKLHPEVGVPLYGPLINTITRGARLKKFYLRSAPTNVGKSRTMVADACYIACDEIYDENFGWIHNGIKEPVLFITTEQEVSEIQTMMLAFLSNVNEDHVLNGNYVDDEEERVRKAADIIADTPIYIDELPDFSLQDIENHIKKAVREFDVKYVFNEN